MKKGPICCVDRAISVGQHLAVVMLSRRSRCSAGVAQAGQRKIELERSRVG